MTTTIGSLDLNAFSDLYSDSNQYFWFESDSSATYGAGAHVTLVPDTTFISNPTGQNILMNTEGFSIRNGLLPMMTLDNDSLDFNVVDTTAGTYTTTATFTATGAQIGQSGGAHSVIDEDGQRFYASDGTTQLANIGYALGASASGTAIAPYYNFGIRKSNTTIGNYSIAAGYDVTASFYVAYAEGINTESTGRATHAEGEDTLASQNYSHAEGLSSQALANASHAEGSATQAKGFASHSGGVETIASGMGQVAIGVLNVEDAATTTTHPSGIRQYKQYAFIIGNGTSDYDPTTGESSFNRSNALAVDWLGEVQLYVDVDSAASETTAATSGTDMDLFNAIRDLGWYSSVIS